MSVALKAPPAREASSGLLTNTAAAIEGAFLKAGGRLGECASLAASIRESLATLPRALASEEVAAAGTHLSGLCGRLREVHAALSVERSAIENIARSINETAAPLAQLNRSVKTVGIVVVSARVTSAAIDTARVDMAVFDRELTALARETDTRVRAFNQTIRELGESAARMIAGIPDDGVYRMLPDLAARIEARLDEFREDRASASGWAESLSEPLGAAASAIGAGVLSLQVGDSVRQRLEHAGAVLASTRRLSPALDAGERAWIGAGADALLQGLITHASEDLDDGLDEVGAAMDRIEAACSLLASSGHRQAAAGARTALADEVEAALEVLASLNSGQEKIDRMARAVVDSIAALKTTADSISEIESEMRLASMNTIIKCSQLGEGGRALNVIAQQLSAITAETVAAVHEVVQAFNGTVEQTTAYTEARNQDSTATLARMRADGAAALDVFAGINDQVALGEKGLDRAVVGIIDHVRYAKSAFGALRAATEKLDDQAFELAARSDPPGLPAPGSACAEFARSWRAVYTMQSERVIHDNLFGAVRTEAPPELAIEMF